MEMREREKKRIKERREKVGVISLRDRDVVSCQGTQQTVRKHGQRFDSHSNDDVAHLQRLFLP